MSEILVGTVVDCEVPVIRAELAIDDARHHESSGKHFALLLDDGSKRRIEVAPDRLDVKGGNEARRDNWGDLASDPRASLFAGIAPGDHVKVSLAGFAIGNDTRIAVRGTMHGERLFADCIAIARDGDAAARAAVQPVAPKPTPVVPAVPARGRIPLETLSLVLFFLGAAGGGFGTPLWSRFGWAPVTALGGVFAMIFGLCLVLARPPFDGVDDESRKRDASIQKRELIMTPPWQTGLPLLVSFALFVAVMLPVGMFSKGGKGVIPMGIVVAIGGVIPALWIWFFRRTWLRVGKLVARGLEATSLGPSLEREVSFVKKKEYRTVSERTQDGGMRSVDRWVSWIEGHPSTSTPDTLRARTADGQDLVVELSRAVWFAPTQYGPAKVAALQARIDEGHGLLLLGRVQDGRMRATGPESLIVFGASGSARGALRRHRRTWYATWVAVLALSALAVALPVAMS